MRDDLEVFGLVHTLEGTIGALTVKAFNGDKHLPKYRGDIREAYEQLGRVLSMLTVREVA